MTIDFGTETVRTFDRLEAMSNRTVGVAKLCRHGLTGRECSRDPVPTRCSRRQHDLDHSDAFVLEMSWPCGASTRDRMRVATVSTPAGSSVRAGTEKA